MSDSYSLCLAHNLVVVGAVNMATRVQGLSRGNDVVVTDAVVADIEAETMRGATRTLISESFNAELRSIAAPVSVHRLIEAEVRPSLQHYSRRLAYQTEATSLVSL